MAKVRAKGREMALGATERVATGKPRLDMAHSGRIMVFIDLREAAMAFRFWRWDWVLLSAGSKNVTSFENQDHVAEIVRQFTFSKRSS